VVVYGSMGEAEGWCTEYHSHSSSAIPLKDTSGSDICYYNPDSTSTCDATWPGLQRLCACDCPDGRYWDTTTKACALCSAGTATKGLVGYNTPSSVCQDCEGGKSSLQGSTACVEGDCATTGQCCGPGTGVVGTECAPCSANEYPPLCATCLNGSSSPAASSAESDCLADAGFTGSVSSVSACVSGTYKETAASAAACTGCSSGTYNTDPGSLSIHPWVTTTSSFPAHVSAGYY
jgi:hypothetical protein